MKTNNFTVVLLLLAAAVSLSCSSKWNFEDPYQRVTRNTAYTLPKGQVRLGGSVLGQSLDNVGVSANVAVGYSDWGHLEMNLAHIIFGIVNVNAKFNIIDKKHFGLGTSLECFWIKPRMIWVLPDDVKNSVKDSNFIILPMQIESSFPVNNWLQFDLAAGFKWTGLFGSLDIENTSINEAIGSRQLYILPSVQFHVNDSVNIILSSHLMIYGTSHYSGKSEFLIAEGIKATVETTQWHQMPFSNGSSATIKTQFKLNKYFYYNIWFKYHGLLSKYAINREFLPGMEIVCRF